MSGKKFVLPIFLAASGFFCGCATPLARTMVIVPHPEDTAQTHVPAFSRIMAERIQKEIDARGYAAIVPAATARPDSCRVADTSDGEADWTLHAWVQQVDLPKHPGGDKPMTWGGVVLRNASGLQLARSVSLLETPGAPSTTLFTVAAPDDPRARKAADAFGATILDSLARFAEKVLPYLQ